MQKDIARKAFCVTRIIIRPNKFKNKWMMFYFDVHFVNFYIWLKTEEGLGSPTETFKNRG